MSEWTYATSQLWCKGTRQFRRCELLGIQRQPWITKIHWCLLRTSCFASPNTWTRGSVCVSSVWIRLQLPPNTHTVVRLKRSSASSTLAKCCSRCSGCDLRQSRHLMFRGCGTLPQKPASFSSRQPQWLDLSVRWDLWVQIHSSLCRRALFRHCRTSLVVYPHQWASQC